MKKELNDLLLEYLGELKFEYENCFDTGEQLRLKSKINSAEILLGLPLSTKNVFPDVGGIIKTKPMTKEEVCAPKQIIHTK